MKQCCMRRSTVSTYFWEYFIVSYILNFYGSVVSIYVFFLFFFVTGTELLSLYSPDVYFCFMNTNIYSDHTVIGTLYFLCVTF